MTSATIFPSQNLCDILFKESLTLEALAECFIPCQAEGYGQTCGIPWGAIQIVPASKQSSFFSKIYEIYHFRCEPSDNSVYLIDVIQRFKELMGDYEEQPESLDLAAALSAIAIYRKIIYITGGCDAERHYLDGIDLIDILSKPLDNQKVSASLFKPYQDAQGALQELTERLDAKMEKGEIVVTDKLTRATQIFKNVVGAERIRWHDENAFTLPMGI